MASPDWHRIRELFLFRWRLSPSFLESSKESAVTQQNTASDRSRFGLLDHVKASDRPFVANRENIQMKLTCPACKGELSPYKCEVSSLEIDCCFNCRGLWFDGGELRRFFSSPKLYKKFRLPEQDFRGKPVDSGEARTCPRCTSQVLNRVQVGDVLVDECGGCKGIWLDSGEICRLIDMQETKKLKGKSETAKQIRKGAFDRTPMGQASHMVGIAFKMLF
jgi:Zn-finger nucleic acid-binding protein